MHNNRSRTVRYNKTLITAPQKRKKDKLVNKNILVDTMPTMSTSVGTRKGL